VYVQVPLAPVRALRIVHPAASLLDSCEW
jgi:hypothetical protein